MTVLLDRNPDLMPDMANGINFEPNLFLFPHQPVHDKTLLGIDGYQALSAVSNDLETFLEGRSTDPKYATPRELAVVALKTEILQDLNTILLEDEIFEKEANKETRAFTYCLEPDQAVFVKNILVELAALREYRRQATERGDPAWEWLYSPNAPRPQQVGNTIGAVAVYGFSEERKVA